MIWLIVAMYACATIMTIISAAMLITGGVALSRLRLIFLFFILLAFLFSLIKGIMFLWRPFLFPREAVLSLLFTFISFLMFILASWTRPEEK